MAGYGRAERKLHDTKVSTGSLELTRTDTDEYGLKSLVDENAREQEKNVYCSI